MKKLLAILFAAVLCIALGVTAWAAEPADYTIVLSGGEIKNGGGNEITVTGISYDAEKGAYVFNGVNFETTDTYAIQVNDADAKIILKGTNNVKSIVETPQNYSDGIVGKAITFSGDGTLNVTGGKAKSRRTGIATETGAVTVTENAKINATGGQVTGSDGRSNGIWAYSSINFSGNANVTANGGEAPYSYGIYFSNGRITISGNATVNATGGTATNSSYGIFANNTEISNAAKVTAIGSDYGIWTGGLYLSGLAEGGKVTAKATTGNAIRSTTDSLPANWKYINAEDNSTYSSGSGTGIPADLKNGSYLEIAKADAVPTTYTVTYDINGGTGTVPTDSAEYASGAEVTVKSGEGLTIADEYQIFVGWNTAANGSGKSYEAGEKITVEDNDIVLYAEWDAKVEIGGVAVTSSNKSGEGWSYDLATKTLTLEDYDEGSIKSEIDLNIVLNGENKVESGKRKAIEVNGNLKISGNGKLTATGDDVDATGSNKQHSVGIYAYGNIDIVSGTIIANGGDVERTDSNSYGIRSENGNITISGNANVTAAGGDATNNSNGIRAKGDVVISGYAIVKASGGAAKGCYGFRVDGNITVSENANVTAVGKLGGGSLNNLTICGIRATKLTISGKGSVDAAIGDAPSGKAFDLGSLELPEKYEYRTVSGAEYTSGEKTPFVLADNAAKIYIKIKGTEASTSGEDENPNPNPDPKPDPDPKPETKPEACDHKFDANGKCSRCGVIVISYPRDEAEANPNTGAPVVNGFAAIAVLAAGAICLGKRK